MGQQGVDIAASILGLAGLLGVAWAVFRVKGTQATIDLLEQSLRIERTERQQLELRCQANESRLQGQIDVLTSQFVAKVLSAIREVNGER